MLDHSSQVSAGSTRDSKTPDTTSSSNAKPTSGDDASSSITGPPRPATPTYETWTATKVFGGEYEMSQVAPTLGKEDYQHNMIPMVLTSSAADSPAKTSASPDDEEDSPAAGAVSSSSSLGSLTLFSPLGDGSSLRTFPDSYPATVDAISPSFSRRWPTSGFTTARGECWTADTSECPNAADACSSSLADILEDDVPPRYFLSPRAAAGILRRAERRGRELPSHLLAALEAVARTTTTDKPDAS